MKRSGAYLLRRGDGEFYLVLKTTASDTSKYTVFNIDKGHITNSEYNINSMQASGKQYWDLMPLLRRLGRD